MIMSIKFYNADKHCFNLIFVIKLLGKQLSTDNSIIRYFTSVFDGRGARISTGPAPGVVGLVACAGLMNNSNRTRELV